MAQVKQGDTVKVHYIGRLEDGTIFDSSKDRDPLQFTLGSNQIIPGFEEAILGMGVGETKTVDISSENAYGPHIVELVHEIDRSRVPSDIDLHVGQQLQMTTDNNEPIVVIVAQLTDETITLDANHPLAGQDLNFDIELVEIF